jgi:hypothetical protein
VIVSVHRVDQTTNEETFMAAGDVRTFFESNGDGSNEEVETVAELEQFGRAWVGGGAAQLFKFTRIDR